ncbi:MAG: aminopeptidase [Anaerolineae bacterium]
MTGATFDQNLRKYANLLVKVGVNLREGEPLHLTVSLTDDPTIRKLVHYTVEAAYQARAKYVDVNWNDDYESKLRVLHAPDGTLDYVPSWRIKAIETYAAEGVSRLAIIATDPALLAGLDMERVSTMQRARQAATAHLIPLIIDENIWSLVAVPVREWADLVFPDAAQAERLELLWDAIFKATRIYEDDPVSAWKTHQQNLVNRGNYLNQKQYAALHFTGEGTDLMVGLPQGHIWEGGGSEHSSGRRFAPNMPTEEIFTLPHRERVNGTVKATKPLSYQGNIIDGFSFTIEDGRITGFQAEQGGEVIQKLIDTDEGSRYFGEVALVPHSSPISQSGILFFNTLFDENAACHIAIGRAYAKTLQGGKDMEPDQFVEAGGNISQTHVDFMIGGAGIDIDGITLEGKREPVMRQGEWAFGI